MKISKEKVSTFHRRLSLMVGRDEIPATGQRVSIPGRHDKANEIVLIMQMDHQHTAWK
jgi:hypothetical protein